MMQESFGNLLMLEETKNPDYENELIVDSVILRMYNYNPSVFINVKLNAFITDVSQELYEVSKQLVLISQ